VAGELTDYVAFVIPGCFTGYVSEFLTGDVARDWWIGMKHSS
jgi:hypothetical protein